MADLRFLVQSLLAEAQVPATLVDTSALEGYVPGLVVGKTGRVRDALQDVQAIYNLEFISSSSGIRVQTRQNMVTAMLTESDLVRQNPDDSALQLSREEDLRLPEAVDIVYLDPSSDYQAGTQSALRQVTPPTTRGEQRVNIALTAAQAKVSAEQQLQRAWAERVLARFNLSLEYSYLEPGDLIILAMDDGHSWLLRLLKLTLADNMLEVEAVQTALDLLDQPGVANGRLVDQRVNLAEASELRVLDIPLLPEGQDVPGYYYAVAKAADDTIWQFATLFESRNDLDYSAQQVISSSAVVGTCDSLLEDSQAVYVNNGDTLTVTLHSGTLQSVDEAALLNGSNLALVGSELIQFRDALLISEHSYLLSGLLRGRFGTEYAIGNHQTNESFALINNSLSFQALNMSERGLQFYAKAVSNGLLLEETDSVAFTPQAVAQKPYSPVHGRGQGTSNGDLTIGWTRRSRLSASWQDGTDVPLGEESPLYQVDIMNGSAVLRTLESSVTSIVYTEAMQTADFGGAQASVTVRIYQLSAVVGRGWPLEITL